MPIDRSELEAVLADLVRIDARNPWLIPGAPGEAAVAAFVADRVRNLDVERAIDEVRPGRPNVVARWRGRRWTDARPERPSRHGRGRDLARPIDGPGREGDRMTGLGAADDKGHVALLLARR